jgi:hypothetical protein
VALREVAEGEPALGEERLGLGTPDARLERRRARDGVEFEEAVHPTEVEADDGVEPAAQRLDAADDARAAAERHDGDPGVGADGEHRTHLVVGRRRDDGVGGVARVAGAEPDEVGVAAAARAADARLAVGGDAVLADDGGEARPDSGGQPARWDRHRSERHGGRPDGGVEAELGAEQAERAATEVPLVRRVAPPRPGHRRARRRAHREVVDRRHGGAPAVLVQSDVRCHSVSAPTRSSTPSGPAS